MEFGHLVSMIPSIEESTKQKNFKGLIKWLSDAKILLEMQYSNNQFTQEFLERAKKIEEKIIMSQDVNEEMLNMITATIESAYKYKLLEDKNAEETHRIFQNMNKRN